MARSSSLRPARRHLFKETGASEVGRFAGNKIFRNNPMITQWRPVWGGTTTVRFLPGRHPDNPEQWDDCFLSTDINDLGDWIRRYPAVRSTGATERVSFVIKDAADASLDVELSPPWILYRAVHRAMSQGRGAPAWVPLTMGGNNQGAALAKPSEIYVAQCIIVENKGRGYNPPKGLKQNEPLPCLEMSSSAGRALLDQVNMRNQGVTSENFADHFAHGDITSFDKGAYVTFFKLGEDPREARRVQQAQGAGSVTSAADAFGSAAAGGGQGGGNRGNDPIGYDCMIEPTYNGTIGADLSAFEGVLGPKIQPWEEVVYIPTYEEQALMLAERFPPDMIMYAFADHPNWIPDKVRAAAVAASSAPVNAPPQGAWDPSQAPPAPPAADDAPGQGNWPPPDVAPPPAAAPATPATPPVDETPQAGPMPGADPSATPPPTSDGTVLPTWGEMQNTAAPPAAAPPATPAVDAAVPTQSIEAPPVTGADGFDQRPEPQTPTPEPTPATTTPPPSGGGRSLKALADAQRANEG